MDAEVVLLIATLRASLLDKPHLRFRNVWYRCLRAFFQSKCLRVGTHVGTRNHQAVIKYRETDFLPLIEFAHRLVGFHALVI